MNSVTVSVLPHSLPRVSKFLFSRMQTKFCRIARTTFKVERAGLLQAL